MKRSEIKMMKAALEQLQGMEALLYAAERKKDTHWEIRIGSMLPVSITDVGTRARLQLFLQEEIDILKDNYAIEEDTECES